MPVLTHVLVRRLLDNDRPRLEEMYDSMAPLGEALGLPPRDPVQRRVWQASLREEGINLVAFQEERLAGHLALLAEDDTVELMCFVHQDCRRQGVGTAMVRAAMEEARAAGYKRMAVFIDTHNKGARQGLLKFGFRPVWEDLEEAEYSLTL